MKKVLKANNRRRTKPRRTVGSSQAMANGKVSLGVSEVRMASGIQKRTREARRILRVGSPRPPSDLDPAGAAGRHHTHGYGEGRAARVSVSPGQLDVSTDYMPAGVEYLHLPPCDPPNEFRRLHLCLMVDADGEIVGSGHGSTWIKARIEACAMYRRSRIRCVSVREPEAD